MKILELENECNIKSHSTGKVIIDFYASWCAPCKNLSKAFSSLSKEETFNDISVVKVNIENCQSLAENYQIRSLPTIIFTDSGKILKTKVGSLSKNDLATVIKETYDFKK